MIGVPLSARARRTRHIEVTDQLAIVVHSEVGFYFPARVLPAAVPARPSDASPRETQARQKLVWATDEDLRSADRVEIYGDATYELLGEPRPLRTGAHVVGYEVEVMDPAVLYPAEAEVYDQGGDESLGDVRVAIFSAGDQVADRGDYTAYLAQAPIEHEILLSHRGRTLRFGDREMRIAAIQPNFEIPFVQMQLVQQASAQAGS